MPARLCVFLVCLTLIASCKDKEKELPPLYPVKGKVTHNNKAVVRGYVRFTPESNEDYMVQSLVDDNGNFELETVRAGTVAKGAPAGTYRVFFNPDTGGGQSVKAPLDVAKTYTIEATNNDLTIELTAK